MAVAIGAIVVARLFGKADAQYKTGTALYEDHLDIAEAELTASLKGGEYVEDVFYPERQVRNTLGYSWLGGGPKNDGRIVPQLSIVPVRIDLARLAFYVVYKVGTSI